MGLLAGVEAGGTKFVCAVGTGPSDIVARTTIPTTTPADTLAGAVDFLRRESGPELEALGIASFGPLDATTGLIADTPKVGWKNTDLVTPFRTALGIPVRLDTDVNGAALGEAALGAGRGRSSFVYLTVGTGIGGAALVGGQLLRGAGHPEMGHFRIPHDRAADPFEGTCPFHGDCWEGLAAGPAIERRWGRPPADLAGDDRVWALESRYLALGIVALAYVLAPELVIAGGGVMSNEGLLPLVREEVAHLLGGYAGPVTLVPPGLDRDSGIVGALVLAQQAAAGAG
jgi:fructokinase